MVDALICSKNWLRSRDQINLGEYMDEVNAYEDIDSGNFSNFLNLFINFLFIFLVVSYN